MSTTPTARYRRIAAACVLTCAVGLSSAPLATALPNGMSPQEALAVVSAPISVPAGETVTVDIGVPVSASYSGGGWTVSSAGTAVTVTAPNTPGAQANFTASAAGQSAPITLVAEGTAAAPAAPAGDAGVPDSGSGSNPAQGGGTPGTGGSGDAAGNDAGATGPGGPGDGAAAGSDNTDNTADPGSAEGAAPQEAPAPDPDDQPASEVDTAETEYLELDAVIEGNTLSTQLGLSAAAKLLRQFQDIDQESVKLRYLDVNGNIIEGVNREVDLASRSMTLIYPEGETPDNPFFLQVVRDDAALLEVRLTDPNQPVASASTAQAAKQGEEAEQAGAAETQEAGIPIMGTVLGILALVIVVAIAAAVTLRSRRAKRAR